MVETYTLGFNEMHGSGDYRVETISTMEKWVFGFDIGNQPVPLIQLGFRGSQNLGLAHDGFVISLVIWGLVLALHRRKMEVTSRLGR